MLPFKRKPTTHRYYLLPGMGQSNRRRRRRIWIATLVVGLLASAGSAFVIVWLNR